jgi:hypothetical protein
VASALSIFMLVSFCAEGMRVYVLAHVTGGAKLVNISPCGRVAEFHMHGTVEFFPGSPSIDGHLRAIRS